MHADRQIREAASELSTLSRFMYRVMGNRGKACDSCFRPKCRTIASRRPLNPNKTCMFLLHYVRNPILDKTVTVGH